MPKHTGLGKGLDALLPSGFQPEPLPAADGTASGGVLNVPVEKIIPNPRQPRTHFDLEALGELAASIREHGIIQPLLVSRDDKGDGYILVAGERRWQASKLAEMAEVPVIVRQTTDLQRLELALIENLQRADLNPLEEANAYRQLSDDFSFSHEEIASRVGKNRVTITNTIRLLRLSKEVQQALVDRLITEGHARALLSLETEAAMNEALKTVLKGHVDPETEPDPRKRVLTVRETEELVRRLLAERPQPKLRPPQSPEVLDLQQRLSASLGIKVALKTMKQGSGMLSLYYDSNEQLDDLLSRLLDEHAS